MFETFQRRGSGILTPRPKVGIGFDKFQRPIIPPNPIPRPAGTVLLMHMNNNIVDSTGLHVPYWSGTGSFGTGKFNSAVSADASSCIKIPYVAGGDLTLGTANWRIEFRGYLNAYTGRDGSSWPHFFSHQRYHDATNTWQGTSITINPATHCVKFATVTAYSTSVEYQSTVVPALTTWHHFEMTRSGGTIYCFMNGVLLGTIDIGASAVYQNADASWKICAGSSEAANNDNPASVLNGMVDEFILAIGSAGHTATFTPPPRPFL